MDEADIDYDVLDVNRLLVSSENMEEITDLLENGDDYIDFEIV